MICPKCNGEVDEKTGICLFCRFKVLDVNNTTNALNNTTQNNTILKNNQNKTNKNELKKHILSKLMIKVIAFIIFIILCIIFFKYIKDKGYNNENDKVIENDKVNENNNIQENNTNIEVNDKEESQFVTQINVYNVKITTNTKTSGMSVASECSGIIDEVKQVEYLECKNETMGIPFTNKTYTDYKSGYSYSSVPFTEQWVKDAAAPRTVNVKDILNKLISMKDVTKVSDNHYKIKMTKDDIKGLMNSSNGDASAIKGNIYVDAYTSNGYITKLYYDFSEAISGFESYTTTIELSNYNSSQVVEIPSSVISSAKENK